MARGRPSGQITFLRALALYHLRRAANRDDISMSWLAKECGLYDYREARRIVRDLSNMNLI